MKFKVLRFIYEIGNESLRIDKSCCKYNLNLAQLTVVFNEYVSSATSMPLQLKPNFLGLFELSAACVF